MKFLDKWIARSRSALTLPEVQDALEKGRRALEVEVLHKSQSVVDKTHAEAVSLLLQQIATVSHAAIQVGSILIAKVTDGDGQAKVFVLTLTPNQLMLLEREPELISSPQQLLDRLLVTPRRGRELEQSGQTGLIIEQRTHG